MPDVLARQLTDSSYSEIDIKKTKSVVEIHSVVKMYRLRLIRVKNISMVILKLVKPICECTVFYLLLSKISEFIRQLLIFGTLNVLGFSICKNMDNVRVPGTLYIADRRNNNEGI